MKIFPSAYLPSVGYFAELVGSADAVVDCGEHYLKRSLRNRATIMTAQGAMALTIPVCNANRMRYKMSSVEIDNSKRWQHQHWIAIVSAYRSSPYFDHYAPYFEPLYNREWSRLVEFNEALMGVIIKLLNMGRRQIEASRTLSYELSGEYVIAADSSLDMRAKGSLDDEALQSRGVELPQYMQVFGDRLPFEANMSIIDLLFCEGPATLDLLVASRK